MTDFDVVVVGSGAAGMTAVFGGSTARSGAGIWIPNNEVVLAAGVPDTAAKAAAYLARVVGAGSPAAKQQAFLAAGPTMISFVLQHTPLRFRWMEGYSDYFPELAGGMPNGRSIEPAALDGNILGPELANLNPSYIPAPAGTVVYTTDYKWLNLIARHPRGLATATEIVTRYLAAAAQGQRPITMGQSLAGGLRAGLLAADVPVWLNTTLVDLYVEAGQAKGVRAIRNGQEILIRARRGGDPRLGWLRAQRADAQAIPARADRCGLDGRRRHQHRRRHRGRSASRRGGGPHHTSRAG